MNAITDAHQFLRSRRSVRRFQPEPLGLDAIQRMLLTASSASSAHNRQPWRYAVVSSTANRTRLAETMAEAFRHDLELDGKPAEQVRALVDRSISRILAAPVAIVLCMDTTEMDVYPDGRRSAAERIMALQSTANAGTTLLLAAHAEGLGGVWSCSPLFAQEAVVAILGLPSTWEPQALILIGRPAESPAGRERKPLAEVSRFL